MRLPIPAPPEAAVRPLTDTERAKLAALDLEDPPTDAIEELFARVEALEARVLALATLVAGMHPCLS